MSGLIDWLTLRIDPVDISDDLWRAIREKFPAVVMKYDRVTGTVDWEIPAHENIRSDSHQLVLKCGATLTIQGSPARLIDENNVFGSDDIQYCARKMIVFASQALGLLLPSDLKKWSCSRIDFTCNYVQESRAEVDEILRTISMAESCRQARATYENGVTFGAGSTLHMGIVYGKGRHLRMLIKQGKATATEEQLKLADKLIRLEYRMRKKWLDRNKSQFGHWSNITTKQLIQFHSDYFSKFISNYEVADMSNLIEMIEQAAPTKRQAQAAHDCFMRIREYGFKQAKATYNPRTFYRHIKCLRAAGLTDANFVQSSVVPITRKSIELGHPVSSWAELQRYA